jgi:integrase
MGKRKDGCLYKRGPFWWMKYSIDGVPQFESTKTADDRKARDKLRERLVEVRKGLAGAGRIDRVRVDSLLDDLVAYYELNNPKSVDEFARPFVKKHLRPCFGKLRVPQITTDLLRQYRVRKLVEGLSDATINRTLALLRRAFHLGAEATPPKVIIIPKFPMVRESNVRTGFLEHEQYRTLLLELPAELKPLLVVGYHVGCRIGELLAMKWLQVDLASAQIRLYQGTTKNGEGRMLPIYGDMLTMLAMYRQERDQQWPRCPWVFHRCGSHIRNFRKAWESACARASVPGLQFHDLRRSAVRNMERAGIPRSVAMRISGH